MTATEVQQSLARPSGTPAKKSRKWFLPILISILVNAGVVYYWFKVDTYHYVEVAPGVLYRDGNQGLRRFSTALNQSQAKSIVSLIDEREIADPKKPQFKDEQQLAVTRGLKQLPVPIALGGWPTTDDVRKFLAIAEQKENQPVLVHCAQGVRRTGMMVAAYQMSVLNYDKAKAQSAIETFGHSERTVGDIRKFIDAYDPATRTVTQAFEQSKE